MELVRWYARPVIIGFIFCLLLNPLIAGPGFIVWLALMYYVYKRLTRTEP